MLTLFDYVVWVDWGQTQCNKLYGFIVLLKLICGALKKLVFKATRSYYHTGRAIPVHHDQSFGCLTSFTVKDFLDFPIMQEFCISI